MKIQKEKTTSFLSEGIELRGELFVKGGIRIDGQVIGKIEGESTVYIGDAGKIQADIVAHSVVSSGNICGNISAEDIVKMNNPGTLEGQIITCNLGIEKGVYFSGKCQILSPKNNPRPKLLAPRQPNKAIAHRK